MSNTVAYTPVVLIPSDVTSTSGPFVAPPFVMAFRQCEKLFWEGESLQREVSQLRYRDFSTDVEGAVSYYQQHLALRLMFAEMPAAKESLEKTLASMGSPLDLRYTQCKDADCMEGWLLDGRRLNVIKGRALLQDLETVMQDVQQLLEASAESACEARTVLNREFEKAMSGRTTLSCGSDRAFRRF